VSSSEGTARAEGLERLRRGTRALSEAVLELNIEGSSPRLHEKARQAMPVLRSAMDWLEDTDLFEVAHARLDILGRLALREFPEGCTYALDEGGGQYFQECPVALAHNRIGMSPGYIIRKAECSVCGLDPEDCHHIRGRIYDGVRCHRRLVELDLLEVSFVGRPAQPDARITRVSLPLSELRERFGEDFEPGRSLPCNRCLSACGGVTRPFETGPRVIIS
jgi:hypothetical protein